MSGRDRTYSDKRSFSATPEPQAAVAGNVDPGRAPVGESFVIHQHHARRLHFDLRLEMRNGDVPVLVSWAVPKNLPTKKGKAHLAIHVEDHPFDYGSFEGTIPQGNYGAGEVRIFDSGTYEVLEQEEGKLSIRLRGRRLRGVYHMHRTGPKKGEEEEQGPKNEWIVFMRQDERPPPQEPPRKPMLASSARDPFDDEGWLFEPKWDGVRAVAICGVDTLLLSRNTKDMTATYPELARLNERFVALDCVVDGEIVAMDGGRPSFERLQSRINLQNANDIKRAMKAAPVSFIAFDLIYLDGRSLTDAPLEERKSLLERALVPSPYVSLSQGVVGEGKALSNAAREQRLEGIVAKRLGSLYRPGRRTSEWLKIKVVHEADVVIGGWSRGEGARGTSFGALLVGAYEGDSLRFVGAVGTGFSDATMDDLLPRLASVRTDRCPFAIDPTGTSPGTFGKPIKDPEWARPELVCKVEYRELTSAGRFRAPSYKGLRADKDPRECLVEDLPT